METTEIIARQTAKMFELEDEISRLSSGLDVTSNDLKECEQVIDEIRGITGWTGHILNLARAVRSQLADKKK